MRDKSADEVWIQAIQGLDREGFDFIVHDGPPRLAESAEDAFHNDLIAFSHFRLSEADHFEGTGMVLQEKAIGRLPLPIRCQLHIRDFSRDDDFLTVILLWVCQQFGDLKQS